MTELQTRTPAQFRPSGTNPSTRRVATRRHQTGSTSRTRMAPWRNRGASWEELKAAEAFLDTFQQFLDNFERKRVEHLTDMELFRETLRAITITHRSISRALEKHVSMASTVLDTITVLDAITVQDTITVLEKCAAVSLQLSKSYEIIVEAKILLDEATVRTAKPPAQA